MLTGKSADVTGPNITEQWGVTCTNLGASVLAPNGKLVSVFGDTFSGRRVGEGDWRSPVVLIGTGDANNEIVYEHAGGPDPDYARQLWPYIHDDASTGWTRGGISTVIPSDLLRVDDSLYLHAIVNHGFGNVMWSEIWKSDDSGVSWTHMGEGAKFPGNLHGGHAQCWSWDYDPETQWGLCGLHRLPARQGHHSAAGATGRHRRQGGIHGLAFRRRPVGLGWRRADTDHAARGNLG